MVKVEFYGYSDSKEYIENTGVEVEDIFKMYFPESDYELKYNKEETEFQFIFSGEWTNAEDIDEDVVREICNNHELYCSIHENGKSVKKYYYDEDDVFVYD